MRIGETVVVELETLGRRIGARCRLAGEFRLRSGETSDVYFDKYLFEGDPVLLEAVATHLEGLVPPGTEVLAGLELGGVPVATALSIRSGLPVAFVRKAPKAYGTMKLAEGTDVRGREVVVVEDVITTGGQVQASVAALRALGSEVRHVVCVIDRGGAHPGLHADGINVRALFRSAELGP